MTINSQPRDGRSQCMQIGCCVRGCKSGAKWSTLYTEIPKVEATGNFEIRPESHVAKIEHNDSGKVTGVACLREDRKLCELYVKTDPILYESRSRSVRIRGALTSLRLENMMRDTLAQIALEDGRTTNSPLVQLHDVVMAHRCEVNNFASFLRVTCLHYLRHKCESSLSNLPKHVTNSPVVRVVGHA